MAGNSSWERFFDLHAPVYHENSFTTNTAAEVDFLQEELRIPPGGSILDVGCGTGRHSIGLARRGFEVTGLDLSAGMLSVAADEALKAGVDVRWIRADASRFSFRREFDAAICICEGAFGLLGGEDDPIGQPLSILRNVSGSLRPGGRFVLTALNGTAMLRKYGGEDISEGRFDPVTMVESSQAQPGEGMPAVNVRERGFVPTELVLMCRSAGMAVSSIWGGTAGRWRRIPPDPDEMEIMVVARRRLESGERSQ